MVRRTSFKEIVGTEDELDFLQAVEKFNCQDKEVEKFLKEKALDFDKSFYYIKIPRRRESVGNLFYILSGFIIMCHHF